ncbi:MAG: MMPL family transporter [Iamia sp.]
MAAPLPPRNLSTPASPLYRLGRFAASRPWTVIGVWLVVAVVVIGASSAFGRDLQESFEVPGVDSQQAVELLSRTQSDEAGLTARVVLTPLDDNATFFDSAEAVAALDAARARLVGLDAVIGATDPAAALATSSEAAVDAGVVSADGRIALVSVQYPVLESLDAGDLEQLTEAVADAGIDSPLQIEAGGDLFFAFDEPETGLGEMIGLAAAVIVLLVAFGSLIAMGLPIGMALFGLAVGVSSFALVTYLIEIPSWVPEIGAMVGLGVGIDYALFLVTRHREYLAEGLAVSDAAGRSVATAGKAVVFAGGTVVVAILGLAVSGVPFVAAAGVGISLLVLIMVVASITLLPAFLGLSGPWINRLGIHRRGTDAGTTTGAGWERWGRHVTAHPWPYAIGVTALLLALTSPVLSLQLGLADEGTLSETTTQRRAYDLVSDGFGPGANGPLLIAVDLRARDGSNPAPDPATTAAIVQTLSGAVASDPGVAAVAATAIDVGAGVATVVAIPTTSPQDSETVATVARLRADVLPSVLDASGAVGHVGGQTANVTDVAERVSDRLPLFVLAVVVLSFLLLLVLFRSVLVPLKAALLNLLSIGASYGVLVMVFQWGWGKELIGLEGTVPIASFIPMFMFAIVFGLSMDYEVFLLSRVREDYLATGDNDGAVIRGIGRTARVITSAALIMVAVFGGFAMGSDPVTKMFGLGLAVAIAVDATIVRIVLVPATMKLMGDANWWLPGWLDRLLPNIGLDAGDHVPVDATGSQSEPGVEAIGISPEAPGDRSAELIPGG